jgi:vitamin B12 transporter
MCCRRLIAVLVALAASVAPAQDAAPEKSSETFSSSATPLPPVDAPAPAQDALPEPSATAKEPTAVSTIVDASARAGEAKDLGELLAPVPGLAVQEAGGLGQRQSLVLRGASSTGVAVLLDGVPLGAPGTPIDLSRLGVGIVDRIEVLRGPAAARFGPGGLGGVVNILTRAPGRQPTLWGEATQGSFTTTQVQAGGAAALPLGEALATAHFFRSNGDWTYLEDATPAFPGDPLVERTRQNNDALLAGGLLRWRGQLGTVGLDARAEVSGGRRGLAGPAENPTLDTRQSYVRGSGVVRALKNFDSAGTFELTAYARGDRDDFEGAGFAPALHQTTGGVGAELVYTRLLFGWHGLTALISGGGDWLTSGAQTASWGHGSLMLTDELLLFSGKWTIAPSVRLDLSGPFVGVSPRLGTVVLLPLGFELRANGGQTHRPPSFSELYVQQGTLSPNPQLRPERALSVDGALGWKHAVASAQVGGFFSMYEDLISYEYYPPLRARPYNFMAARVAGLEAEAALTPWEWLSASGSYTFLSTQNLKDDERYYLKPLPYRPAHRVTGRLDAGPRWLKLHGEVLFQSEQGINRSNVVQLPARAVFNAGATARPIESPDVRLSLELKNLTDVQAQDLDGYPLPPRAAYLTLAVAWDAAKSAVENH